MVSRILKAAAVAVATSQLAYAQTHTDCNPMEKTCPDDKAIGKSQTVDFTKGLGIFKELAGTNVTTDSSNGLVFSISKETEAPTIASDGYIFFGKIDVTLRACTGTGVVTSFVLQSDDLDEIDWEWLGGDSTQVQTNYFGKGDTTTYDRGAYHPVSNPQETFHTYTIDWTKDYVKWYIDGALVRTLLYNDAKGGTRFPQTPMMIKLGTWVAGRKDAPKGTVEWAGGYTNFDSAPFIAYYKSLVITDYNEGASKYVWTDKSGSYQSIKVVTGDTSGTGESSSAASSSTKTSTSSTKASSATSKTTLTTASSSSAPTSSAGSSGSNASTTPGTSTTTQPTSTSGAAAASSSTRAAAAFRQGLELSGALVAGAGVLGSLFL